MTLANDSERFWSKVNKDGPVPPHRPELGKCWVWTAGKVSGGYGAFKLHGKQERAHRVAMELAGKVVPNNKMVCHHCDNPSCVRPEHLFLGDAKSNMADRNVKGRQATGDRLKPWTRAKGGRNGSVLHPESRPRGESSAVAKITESDVLEMRRLRTDGLTIKEISSLFPCTGNNISSILAGRTWRHVRGQTFGSGAARDADTGRFSSRITVTGETGVILTSGRNDGTKETIA